MSDLLQVNLKRKHWDSNASASRSFKRCTQIFQQQLAGAQRSLRQEPGASPGAAAGQGRETAGQLKPWQLKREQQAKKVAKVSWSMGSKPQVNNGMTLPGRRPFAV
jgi:hypothetical protein